MMRLLWPASILCALLPPCSAQEITQGRPHDNIVLSRVEYQNALKAWKDNDQDLEREVATADPAALRIRIRRAAELAAAKSEKEIAYLNAIIHHTRTDQEELTRTLNTAMPLDSRRQAVREEQASVQSELDEIEAGLRDLPAGDEDLRPIYEEERANRKHQLENLAQQRGILDDLARGQAVRLDLLQILAHQQEDLLKGWETTRSHAEAEGEAFKSHYAAMMREVDDRAAGASKGARKKTASGDAAKLAGSWISRPAPAEASPNAPATVLELEISGDTVHGVLDAANVQLTIDGKASSHGPWKLRWTTSDRSASGEIDLILTPDGFLVLERHTKAGKSPLPDGADSLMRRP